MIDATIRDPKLLPIWQKARAGERLTPDEGLTCLATPDLLTLGRKSGRSQTVSRVHD